MKRIGLAIGIATFLGWSGVNPVWATVYYVNANLEAGADDGSSWENAFHTTQPNAQQDPRTPLQRAIDIAVAGDQIWVAKGTYTPHPTKREESFYLRTAVKIYGGFSGDPCETQLSQRDPRNNVTILSGDLTGNDGANFTNYGENSCTVVRVIGQDIDAPQNTTILDGFTITAGNSMSVFGQVDCTSNKDMVFGCQDAHSDGGGGVRYECSGGGKISSCIITLNRSVDYGGAIFSAEFSSSRIWLVNNVIARNRADVFGTGGGIGLPFPANEVEIYNCKIIANECEEGYGGGVDLAWGGETHLVNSVIAHNKILEGSGVRGGGIALRSSSEISKFINCTIAFNDAGPHPGGGIYIAARLNLDNCVIWGNAASDGEQVYSAVSGLDTPNLRHTIVVQGAPNVVGAVNYGVGNFQLDPKFVDPAGDGLDNDPMTWEDNDYSIAAVAPNNLSPALDTGANSYLPNDPGDVDSDNVTSEEIPWDVNRKARRVDVTAVDPDCPHGSGDCGDAPVVDLGAYEGPTCGANGDCYDKNWCTLDTCDSGLCSNHCIGRDFGDVNHSNILTLDDILAIISCFGSQTTGCFNCGPGGTGNASGCDIATSSGCPTSCGSDGNVNLDDILWALCSFGTTCPYTCADCCPGGSPLMGGFGANGPLDAAGQVIGLIALLVDDPALVMGDASDEAITDGFVDAEGNPFDPATVLAQAFVLWVERDLSDEDRAFVVELLMANAQNDSSAGELFDGMAKELAD